MTRRLPRDVVKFLLDNPDEVAKIKNLMAAIKSNAEWRAKIEQKRREAKIVPCGVYGCEEPRNEMDPMCASCLVDYREDPDSFK